MAEIGNDKWISIDEAAEYLGVKPGTIRDWIRKGKDIPAHKIGKQWKFKCSELDNWVSSGKMQWTDGILCLGGIEKCQLKLQTK